MWSLGDATRYQNPLAPHALTAAWLDLTALRHQDPAFRAAGMAIAVVYFLAVISAAVAIQGKLAQV